MTGAIVGEFAKWLAATALSHTIQTAGWVIPALQTIHILGIAVLFFSAVIVDLRLWRVLQRDVPLDGRRATLSAGDMAGCSDPSRHREPAHYR